MANEPPPDNSGPLTPEEQAELATAFLTHRPRLLAWLNFRIPAGLRARLGPNDVLQDAYRIAQNRYRAHQNEGGSTSTYVFLFWVVRDCYLRLWGDHTRACRDHRRDLPWPDESSQELLLGLVDPGSSPSARATRNEDEDRVRSVLALLPPDDMEVLALRYFGGGGGGGGEEEDRLSFADIARVLGIAEPAARQRHARALVRFAGLWQQSGSRKALHP
jgi:RNA polymerase sigma factor (sigma-70 family)